MTLSLIAALKAFLGFLRDWDCNNNAERRPGASYLLELKASLLEEVSPLGGIAFLPFQHDHHDQV